MRSLSIEILVWEKSASYSMHLCADPTIYVQIKTVCAAFFWRGMVLDIGI